LTNTNPARLTFVALSVIALFSPRLAAQTTHYIAANGSDLNNGTSKSTPWAHLPGMVACTASCATYTPSPGDSLILRGGDTWTNSNFPIAWAWSGSNGKNIYIGVDTTWYSGPSWNRPIFSGGGAAIGTTYNMFIRALYTSYQTWDNIEMTGLFWNRTYSYAQLNCGVWAMGQGITISNWYVHGWAHSGAVGDSFTCILGDTNPPYMGNSIIENSIFQDSDGDTNSGMAMYAWPSAVSNVIHDMSNGLLPTGNGQIAYNAIYNIRQSFDPTIHENAIETLIANGTFYIHDNLIHDAYAECLVFGNPNETDYVWNNVVYEGSTGNCNAVNFPQTNWPSTSSPGIALYIWNNTIVPKSGVACFQTDPQTPMWPNIVMENNHCVTTSALYSNTPSATNLTVDHNVLEAPAAASAQGYAASQTYAYSPTSMQGATVGAGANLASNCSGALSGLCSDTSYACSVSASNQIVCPVRSPLTRPTSGAWDSGGYLYLSPVAPPTTVNAICN
jgi:hypothetical protein